MEKYWQNIWKRWVHRGRNTTARPSLYWLRKGLKGEQMLPEPLLKMNRSQNESTFPQAWGPEYEDTLKSHTSSLSPMLPVTESFGSSHVFMTCCIVGRMYHSWTSLPMELGPGCLLSSQIPWACLSHSTYDNHLPSVALLCVTLYHRCLVDILVREKY
jgi:hypothetical protein